MDLLFRLPLWKKTTLFALFLGIFVLSGVLTRFIGVYAYIFGIALILFGFMLFQKPVVLLVIWIFISPLLQNQKINLGAGIPDITADRVFFILLLLSVALQSYKHQVQLHRPKIEEYLLAIFLVFGLISIFFLANANTINQVYYWFQSYLLPILTYFICLQIFKTEKDARAFIYVVIVILITLTVFTPIEYFTGKNILGEPSQFIQGTIRVRSFTGSAWVLGAFAGMYLPFAIYTAYLQRMNFSKKWQYLASIAVVFGVLGIFFTFMRAAWLSVFVFLVWVSLSNRKLWKLMAVFFILGLILVALYPTISQTTIWQERIVGVDTLNFRLVLAKLQLHLFLESPIIGHGIATLPQTYFIATVSNGFGGEYDLVAPSHNMYATILLEFGIISILYLGTIFKILLDGFKAYLIASRNVFWGKELLTMLLGSSLVFLIQAVTFEIRFFTSILLIFWIVLALIKVATGKIFEAASLAKSQLTGKNTPQ